MLRCTVSKRLGNFVLDLSLTAAEGETLVVVGESGSGKSTLLRLLAGLERPDAGIIALDQAEWFSTESGAWCPPAERSVGLVAQDYSLFPHLTVLENVCFGLRAAGMQAPQARRQAFDMLDRLGIGALSTRRPGGLSGGQQQRVALARALVLDPALLLLDEPLSALDLQTRREVRAELRGMLAALSCVTVYVTHSPLEALAFGRHIAVLDNGSLAQWGSGGELLRHPRSPYVAEFIGLNFFQGTIEGRGGGLARIRTEGGVLSVVDPGGEDPVLLAVDPREIVIHADAPSGSTQNVFRGPIVELIPEPPRGERVRIVLGTEPPLVAEVSRAAVELLDLQEGRTVFATFKALGVTVYR
ncbi:MAG TPA: ABC transporter ATP-binding protein [Gemmatimonadales bacterium]|nr:ABC transporter ATP-binding protein [Gemmatimonadales bacterium]